MDFKKFLKFDRNGPGIKSLGKNIAADWMRWCQVIFIAIFVFSSALGLYVWYKSLYQSSWSEERKKEYSLTQNREINLKEEEFQKVLDEIERKKNNFKSEHQPIKDIFKPYDGYVSQ
jgi:hypothetical protein